MKANRMTTRLLLALLLTTTVGCVTYEEGSLLQMRHKEEQRLFTACLHVQLERNMHYVFDLGDLSSACRTWARKQMRPNLPTGGRRVGDLND